MLNSLLTHYLETECQFNDSETDTASNILLLRRPEMEASKLAVLARSHQALRQKSLIVNLILGCVRQTPILMEAIYLFEQPLQRLSNLTKLEYTSVSFPARQLLLTRRQKTFIERTLTLVDNVAEYLECRQPSSAGYFSNSHCCSPSSKALATPVMMHSIHSGSGVKFSSCGFTSNSLIQTFVGDVDGAADDSLIALLAHPQPQVRKVALEIYVRRHFDRSGLHDLRIRCDGESWAQSEVSSPLPCRARSVSVLNRSAMTPTTSWAVESRAVLRSLADPNETPQWRLVRPLPVASGAATVAVQACQETSQGNAPDIQRVNRLLALWTCSSVLSHEFLVDSCDSITEERSATGTAAVAPSPKEWHIPSLARPESKSVMSLLAEHPIISGQENSSSARRNVSNSDQTAEDNLGGLDCSSRLHHMLNAFAGVNEHPMGRSQLIVAMAFATLDEFRETFTACLEEYRSLLPRLPTAPPTADGKILLVFIAAAKDADDGQQRAHNPSSLETDCAFHATTLSQLGFNIIGFSYLVGRQVEDLQLDVLLSSRSIAGLNFAERGTSLLRGRSVDLNDALRDDIPSLAHSLGEYAGRAIKDHSIGVISDDTDAIVEMEKNVCRPPAHNSELNLSQIRCRMSCVPTTPIYVIPTPTEEPFGDTDLINYSMPRYVYFRNLSALPPPIVTEKSVSSKAAAEDSTTDSYDCVSLFLLFDMFCQKAPQYVEEKLLRNVVCSDFGNLELQRLTHFFVQSESATSPNVRVYDAVPKSSPRRAAQARLFVRVLLRYKLSSEIEDWAELERHFAAALNALEVSLKTRGKQNSRPSNHLLMSVIVQSGASSLGSSLRGFGQGATNQHRVAPAAVEELSVNLARRYALRLMNNRIATVEIRLAQRSLQASDTFVPIRIVITNPTQQALRIQKFVEITDPTTGDLVYSALDASDSLAVSARHPGGGGNFYHSGNYKNASLCPSDISFDGLSVNTPHPLAGPLEEKRALAVSLSTIYIYDFLELFEEAIKKHWRSCPKYFVPAFQQAAQSNPESSNPQDCHPTTFLPDKVLESVELVLDSCGAVEETIRDPGQNQCGMVAWKVLMRTPEFPRGRAVVLVGNDVTFLMGTFGVQEDLLFQRVSELARKEGIPRIYIAVNSGARMGLASEVQSTFKVEWLNPDHPAQGFKYLYVTEEDYRKLKLTDAVAVEPVRHPTKGRIYKLTTVIGGQVGLGVENLCGSGAIAGETSRAYDSNVTITLVTGRNVGIGAYVTRLGQRVIQKSSGAPILLTGYKALNRLIGREVYSSNNEIGGVDVMARNGVSHLTVQNDIQGCEEIIRWLSYLPENREGALPIMLDPADPITRPVTYTVKSFTEDPRLMLTGCVDSTGQWLGGIFDRASFKEVLADWAKSVIVGRARLGGIPVGVIAVETRVTEALLPADPAMSSSTETKLLRAGQVWYPDSAYKTAQAISDFNKEEIPLMMFANWRGFSGGQRDMFFEVLKFGSFIVDALVKFKQPCIVYIPPKAELRGGAWVVVDPRINSSYLSMYAAPDSRGGVLEPTATVEIKFRDKALVELAERLDDVLKNLKDQDESLAADNIACDDSRRLALKENRDRRIQELLPIYKQVAIHFADLHDTATRMKRTAAINEIVPWESSRYYFYWKLRSQLILFNLRFEIVKANSSMTLSDAEQMIYVWGEESGYSFQGLRSSNVSSSTSLNAQFVHWACHSIVDISRRLAAVRKEYLKEEVMTFCRNHPKMIVDVVRRLAPNPDPSTLAALFGGTEGVDNCQSGNPNVHV